MIFLDTNVVVALINRPQPLVRQRYKQVLDAGETVALSSVVVFELRYGVSKSAARTKNAAVLTKFLDGSSVTVSFDADDAAIAGTIRASLEAAGTPIGPYDLLIAAQALRHGATLVTANTREFSRVAGLSLLNWAE